MGTIQECLWCGRNLVVPECSSETPREVCLDVRTERLALRRLKDTDRNDLLELLSDSKSLIFSEMHSMDGEQIDHWLVDDAKIKTCIERGYDVCFGIELCNESKLIALVSFIYRSEEFRSAGFDLVVNTRFRRQGYGTEIVRGVLQFAFENANLHRVAVVCYNANNAGLRMLAKAGMRREGELVESRPLNDQWMNMTVFAMLQREWEERLSASADISQQSH